MAHTSIKVREFVDHAVGHKWSIPEFQRGFVWKATQVRDLAESLWLRYPVGSVLLWDSSDNTVPRGPTDSLAPSQWIVDGQQRTTALCTLFGRKPYWWQSGWDDHLKKYDIRFDIAAKEAPFFWVANAALRNAKSHRYVALHTLLNLDTDKDTDSATLQALAETISQEELCPGESVMNIYARLDRIRKIREAEVVAITVDQELEDVVEIFSRLNGRGTRVTEADIYLGVVAAKPGNQGWVSQTFLPFLYDQLKPVGFDVSPNLLFRSLTGVGSGKVRFKAIPQEFWSNESIEKEWPKTAAAWSHLLARFREYGILSNNPMPTDAALVTAVALMNKFPAAPFDPVLYWFLQASRLGRYSGSGTTTLDEDLRDVTEAGTWQIALMSLLRRLPHYTEFVADDFLRDYIDWRFGRFLLYLMVYRQGARDWDANGHRLGFEGVEVLKGFRPQWHHIFPRKFLERVNVPGDKIDALANIAVIGPTINIRISDAAPMDYIARYAISSESLSQQFITLKSEDSAPGNYQVWLSARAERLAKEANALLKHLKTTLEIS